LPKGHLRKEYCCELSKKKNITNRCCLDVLASGLLLVLTFASFACWDANIALCVRFDKKNSFIIDNQNI
jgi:hypothetical protein